MLCRGTAPELLEWEDGRTREKLRGRKEIENLVPSS